MTKQTTSVDEQVSEDYSHMSEVLDKSVALEQEREAETTALAQSLGFENFSYDEQFAMQQIRTSQQSVVEGLMRMGAWLTIIKNNCAHGEFTAKLAELQIDNKDAQRFMLAVKKMGYLKTPDVRRFAKSQIFELMTLSDEQLH